MQAETFTRRYLPHWYMPGAAFFITYRLIDTLPAAFLKELGASSEQFLRQKPPAGVSAAQHRANAHKRWFAQYDEYLDKHQGKSWLADPRVAAIVRSNLYHHHGGKYHLMAYCVMPNHVHLVLQPILQDGDAGASAPMEPIGEREDSVSPLSKIMHSLKSYTAHEANALLRRSGGFWQRESYDHWIRDEDELERIVSYIQANPVTAALVERPQDWFFCSCHDRFLMDGEVTAWLKW